jgi:hypothetical protein
MNAPSDSDRRKARDAALRTQDEAIAQHLEEARRSGELQGAPGFGKPMQEMEGWNETPTEFRLPFKILKNAGIAPPEVELFHKRAALRKELAEATVPGQRVELQQRLGEIEQLIALRLEGMRSSGKL